MGGSLFGESLVGLASLVSSLVMWRVMYLGGGSILPPSLVEVTRIWVGVGASEIKFLIGKLVGGGGLQKKVFCLKCLQD